MKNLILWGSYIEGDDDVDEDGELIIPDWVGDGGENL